MIDLRKLLFLLPLFITMSILAIQYEDLNDDEKSKPEGSILCYISLTKLNPELNCITPITVNELFEQLL